jgi:hypothetical protein
VAFRGGGSACTITSQVCGYHDLFLGNSNSLLEILLANLLYPSFVLMMWIKSKRTQFAVTTCPWVYVIRDCKFAQM